jgi:hypothetical protein
MTPILVYFGHHRCASAWIRGILKDCCFSAGIRYRSIRNCSDFDSSKFTDLGDFVQRNRIRFLALANANATALEELPPFLGFHVVRDPRDVAVSSYFSHLHSHSTKDWERLESHRALLKTLPKPAGLLEDMKFSRWNLENMRRWDYARDNVLEVRMEELTDDPTPGFKEIFRFLGILEDDTTATELQQRALQLGERFKGIILGDTRTRIYGEVLRRTVNRHAFSNKSGQRPRGTEDAKSHFRKGIAGDWENHFDASHIATFKRDFPDLLQLLGYETTETW